MVQKYPVTLGRPFDRTFACTVASVRASVPAELPGREKQALNTKLQEDSGLHCHSFWLADNLPITSITWQILLFITGFILLPEAI